jgi:hypothetical protein
VCGAGGVGLGGGARRRACLRSAPPFLTRAHARPGAGVWRAPCPPPRSRRTLRPSPSLCAHAQLAMLLAQSRPPQRRGAVQPPLRSSRTPCKPKENFLRLLALPCYPVGHPLNRVLKERLLTKEDCFLSSPHAPPRLVLSPLACV